MQISILGSFNEPKKIDARRIENFSAFLVENNFSVSVGGNIGYLALFNKKFIEAGGNLKIILTKRGVGAGYVNFSKKHLVSAEDYFHKKKQLIGRNNDIYIIYSRDYGLGLQTEIYEAIDQLSSYYQYVGLPMYKIFFVGKLWKSDRFVKNIIKNISEKVKNQIFFIDF